MALGRRAPRLFTRGNAGKIYLEDDVQGAWRRIARCAQAGWTDGEERGVAGSCADGLDA